MEAHPRRDNDPERPLDGFTVVLDPGHGGHSYGTSGGNVPEKRLALTYGLLLRDQLEALGATVIMTRTDDSGSTIYDRYELGQRLRPDLYIAVHHNSLAVHRDANEIFVTTGYYFYPQSEQLAKAAVEETHRRTGRDMLEASYAA